MLCECGCDQVTSIAEYNWKRRGYVNGQHKRFVSGHYIHAPSRDLKELLFESRLVSENGCWEWMRHRLPTGYGKVEWKGRKHGVHRLAAHLWLGLDLDSPLLALHWCDHPPCFNPDHLFIGNESDNMNDCIAKARMRWNPPKGERNAWAKIGVANVVEIRRRFLNGELRSDIAKSIGMSWSQTARICSGESWSHV